MERATGWAGSKGLASCAFSLRLSETRVPSTYTSTDFCSLVRPAPSTVKTQSFRDSESGFLRDTSATSLRFCLGSPNVWKGKR